MTLSESLRTPNLFAVLIRTLMDVFLCFLSRTVLMPCHCMSAQQPKD